MEDVPVLLGLEDLEDVKNVLSVVFKSLPSNFAEFIKWIAEVRRQEDGGQSLSQEEKGRLAVKVFSSSYIPRKTLSSLVLVTLSTCIFFIFLRKFTVA